MGGLWLTIGGFSLFALAAAAFAIRTNLQNRVVIENRSGQAVVSATVSIGGDRVEFDEIADGETVNAPLHVTGDTSLTLEARLADATEVRYEGGYLTNGMTGQRPRFVIQPSGVDFRP